MNGRDGGEGRQDGEDEIDSMIHEEKAVLGMVLRRRGAPAGPAKGHLPVEPKASLADALRSARPALFEIASRKFDTERTES
jgi:hypothetical protein